MIVGDRVAERLAHAGISQGELARRVGVSQPTINNLINRSKKGSTHLHRIARELGTTPDYLEGKVDDPDVGADTGLQLSSEEREWLDLFQLMTPEQRRNLRSIARDMARGNSPSTYIHDKRQDYREPDQA